MRYHNGKVEAKLWECIVGVSILVLTSLQILTSFQLMVTTPMIGTTTTTTTRPSDTTPINNDIGTYYKNRTVPTSPSSSFSSSVTSSNTIENDWFDKEWWIQNPTTNSCFFVERICHSGHQWFYDTSSTSTTNNSNNSRTTTSTPTPLYHQPQLSLQLHWTPSENHADMKTIANGYPSILHVQPNPTRPSTRSKNNNDNNNKILQQCHYSPIVNHMTLHSFSNSMLGEFYIRLLMGFWDIVSAIYNHQHHSSTQDEEDEQQQQQQRQRELFLEQTQLYFHMNTAPSTILESHKLFLNVLNGPNPILPFEALLDTTTCRCLQRLFFCGYQQVVDNNNHDDNDNDKNDHSQTTTTTTLLQPGRFIGPYNHADARPPPEFVYAKQKMRTALRHEIIESNPVIQESIRQHRQAQVKQFAVRYGYKSSGTGQHHHKADEMKNSTSHHQRHPPPSINEEDWTIVGLAQRSTRREWLQLTKLQHHCNRKYVSHRLVCVIVNIEDESWSNPVRHVVAHGGLDALIGIHGAQLTEALWMPPRSWVVEFLPWIPIYLGVNWGAWTTWTHRPTPLGVLFSETDLNHVGYPLARYSTEVCIQNVTKQCFGRKPHRWDNRNFYILPKELDAIITKFILGGGGNDNGKNKNKNGDDLLPPSRRPPRSCEDYQRQAGDDYVLYNVNCVPNSGGNHNKEMNRTQVFHFYKSEAWSKRKHSIHE